MAEIAILGYGTVGSGVFEVFHKNQHSIDKKAAQPIRVKKVLDLREFPGDPVERYLTHDAADILNDNDIQVVVEVMGGTVPAYEYVKKALLRGKSVVTSNKELVAKHGAELLEIARDKNINFLFEASVGGGIPIIRPLNQSLTADEIYEITGILNGTTNYILTQMSKDKSYADALLEAQKLGYAEKNPDADVLGYDSCRKLAILLSLALGCHVDFEKIQTTGITSIRPRDFAYAEKIDGTIKLLATARINDEVTAKVAPAVIKNGNPLSTVNDVFNAILIKGNVIGEVMFYGRGAGKHPTASAVVADVVDAVKNYNRNTMHFWNSDSPQQKLTNDIHCDKLVIVNYKDKASALEYFNACPVIEIFENEFAFVADNQQAIALAEKAKENSDFGIQIYDIL